MYSPHKDKIIQLLKQGLSGVEIQGQTGCSRNTLNYHRSKLGVKLTGNVKYDWPIIQEYYNSSELVTRANCLEKFNITSGAWTLAVKTGKIIPKYIVSLTSEQVFCENSQVARSSLKKFIEKEAFLEKKCSICQNEGNWLGNPLTLEIDHINGINNDNRRENLRWLCPNCHSQTPTYRIGNVKRD